MNTNIPLPAAPLQNKMGGNAMGKETNYQILINSENKIPEGFLDTVEL